MPLLNNEEGKKLAADSTLLGRFRGVYAQERPTAEKLTDLKLQLDELLSPVQAIASDPRDLTVPDASLEGQIAALEKEAKAFREGWRKPRLQIAALVESATSASDTPSEGTLDAAIKDAERQELLAETAALEQEKEQAHLEAQRKVAAAETAKIRATAEMEAQRIRDETDAQKKAEEARLAQSKAERERQRLRARAVRPDVRQYLGSFMAKGYMQPVMQSNSVGFERTAKPGPVSFQSIQTVGALEPTLKGLERLNQIACDPLHGGGKNDRPLWHFHPVASACAQVIRSLCRKRKISCVNWDQPWWK